MEKIPYIIHSALSNYGEIGIALGVAIFVLFIVEISLHLGLYGRIASFRLTNRKQTRDEEPAISLVIPLFAEDSDYLDTTLVSMLSQDYKKFEVVLVYVGNNDDFFADIKSLQRVYPHLSPVYIDYTPQYPVSTKIALNVGIKSAKHDFVVISNSDTTPSSERWLSLLAKGFLYGDVVLGYSGVAHSGGVKNFIAREYQYTTSIEWLTSAIRRKTYAGSRNALGFMKSLYFDVRGFNHLDMRVGIDDLFVQQIATPDNVSVVLSPRATCQERSWGGWQWWWHRVKEMQRTHRYYPKFTRASTVAELFVRTLFFAAVLTAFIIMPWEFKVAAFVLLLLRYFFVLFVMVRNTRRLGEMGLVPFHFIYDLIEPLLRFVIAVASRRKPKSLWE